jgi:hypothetical protein
MEPIKKNWGDLSDEDEEDAVERRKYSAEADNGMSNQFIAG